MERVVEARATGGAGLRRGRRSAWVAGLSEELCVFLARIGWLRLPGGRPFDGMRRRVAMELFRVRIVAPVLEEIQRVHRLMDLDPPTRDESWKAFARLLDRVHDMRGLRSLVSSPELTAILGIRPIKLELDITSQCNLRCVMCAFALPEVARRPAWTLPVEDFARIARQVLPYCRMMSFSFSTEPLLHPRIGELIAIAKGHGVPWLYMSTNGLLLDERRCSELVERGLDNLSISIDAATRSTYERIRVGGRFDQLLAGIERLQRCKARAGSRSPMITFNFVLMRSNVRELPDLVDLASRLGVEGIAAFHLTPYKGLELAGESLAGEAELCRETFETTRERARRAGVALALPRCPDGLDPAQPPLETETPAVFQLADRPSSRANACPFPWHFVSIDCHGQVLPCGWWYTEPVMGNVREQSFEAIWSGPSYRQLRDEHRSRALRATCRACPAAGMGNVDNPAAYREVQLGRVPVSAPPSAAGPATVAR
jgi:radical SAM protein with 4Fe4S-binding SPASM domain